MSDTISFTAPGATLHLIGKQFREKLGQGTIKLSQKEGQHFMNIKGFTKDIIGIQFGKISYPNSVSFFLYEESAQDKIKVLSLNKELNDSQKIKDLEIQLKYAGSVCDLESDNCNPKILEKLESTYPSWHKKQVQNKGQFSKISKGLGGLFGAISGSLSKPLETVGKSVESTRQSVYRESVGSQSKFKWENVKEKAKNLNGTLTNTFKPVSDGAKNISDSIGHSFDNSNNSIIKAIRNFGIKTKTALNDGYNEGMGQKKPKNEYEVQTEAKLEEQQDYSNTNS